MAKKKKSKPLLSRFLKFLFKAALVFVLLFLLFIGAVYLGFFGPIPTESELNSIEQAEASVVLDRDGKLLGKYFEQNRTQTEFSELPEHLIQALVATEDARFWEHDGIDYRAYLRVIFRTILLADASGGGGSTLSQQLAKNLFGRADYGRISMGVNKVREAIISRRLERVYSKEEILTLYLNTVSFGENVYGIETAAQRYFSTKPRELTVGQSAVLVGLLKANTAYNPRLHPEQSTERRNIVLAQMVKYGYLDGETFNKLKQEPLGLKYMDLEKSGVAGYFLRHIRPQVEEILAGLETEEPLHLDRDGLVVTTTLSLPLQELAEESLKQQLQKLQNEFDRHWGKRDPWSRTEFAREVRNTSQAKGFFKGGLEGEALQQALAEKRKMEVFTFGGVETKEWAVADSLRHYKRLLRAGFLALDPQTGAVLAWVGGADPRWLPYDHVTSRRQAASTFKPFVYTAALEAGIDPCDRLDNHVLTYEDLEDWTPTNANEESGGSYSMAGALKNSVNIPTVNLLFKTGTEEVVKTAHAMGIESSLPDVPSVALGVASVSLREMVRAYATLANGGRRLELFTVSKISTRNGTVLWEAPEPKERDQVIRAETGALITHILQQAVNEGTGTSLRTIYGVRMDVAGKTGTSQDYADGWFIGYNSKLVCGAWVGGETPNIRFTTGSLGSGAHLALPIVGRVLRGVERNRDLRRSYVNSIPPLPDSLAAKLDCEDYKEDGFFDQLGHWIEGKTTTTEKKKRKGILNWLFGGKKDKEPEPEKEEI